VGNSDDAQGDAPRGPAQIDQRGVALEGSDNISVEVWRRPAAFTD
jgi:hypothetical protein